MFSIGDFARYGRVSVRMLRHYDSIGLLRPARVDAATGYRHYSASQLARLNRIIALKDLGFTLEQVRTLLDERVSAEELRGMLKLRKAELEARISADAARLAGVEVRLRLIESEGQMPNNEVQVKRVPAVRVAELAAVADGFEPHHISPVIGPMFPDVFHRLRKCAIEMSPGHAPVAYYEDAPEGEGRILVHAAVPISADPTGDHGLTIVDLPELPSVATILHHGPMDDVMPTAQTLARWIDSNGYRSLGYTRELYIQYGYGDPADWVTERQEPVTRAGAT